MVYLAFLVPLDVATLYFDIYAYDTGPARPDRVRPDRPSSRAALSRCCGGTLKRCRGGRPSRVREFSVPSPPPVSLSHFPLLLSSSSLLFPSRVREKARRSVTPPCDTAVRTRGTTPHSMNVRESATTDQSGRPDWSGPDRNSYLMTIQQ